VISLREIDRGHESAADELLVHLLHQHPIAFCRSALTTAPVRLFHLLNEIIAPRY